MPYGYIYKITNTVNSKEYYGQTICPSHRWSQHKNACKNINKQSALYSAMRHHGINNFHYEIILSCETQEELNSKEIEIIRINNSICPNGYNIELGGSSSGKRSDETREKIRISNLGKKKSPETIEKMRNSKLKMSSETIEKMRTANLGKKRSPETIEKMRNAMLGKKHSPETIEKIRKTKLDKKRSLI